MATKKHNVRMLKDLSFRELRTAAQEVNKKLMPFPEIPVRVGVSRQILLEEFQDTIGDLPDDFDKAKAANLFTDETVQIVEIVQADFENRVPDPENAHVPEKEYQNPAPLPKHTEGAPPAEQKPKTKPDKKAPPGEGRMEIAGRLIGQAPDRSYEELGPILEEQYNGRPNRKQTLYALRTARAIYRSLERIGVIVGSEAQEAKDKQNEPSDGGSTQGEEE